MEGNGGNEGMEGVMEMEGNGGNGGMEEMKGNGENNGTRKTSPTIPSSSSHLVTTFLWLAL